MNRTGDDHFLLFIQIYPYHLYKLVFSLLLLTKSSLYSIKTIKLKLKKKY